MNFDFICEKFSNYEIEHFEDHIYIKKQGFTEPIKVFYETDMEAYTICFATQHLHVSANAESVLIDVISKYASAVMAAIEFYINGKNCFGGQIETNLLSNITYDSLREYFGYSDSDISHLTFQVYAWDKEYCFEGSFNKQNSRAVEIIKKY